MRAASRLLMASTTALVLFTTIGMIHVAPASASGSVQVVSTSQWGPDVLGLEHFVGEVVNNTSTNESLVQLNLGFYNSSGTLLGTDFTFTSLDDLAPGEKSPFEDDFTPPGEI
jgi:hypothetical protein